MAGVVAAPAAKAAPRREPRAAADRALAEAERRAAEAAAAGPDDALGNGQLVLADGQGQPGGVVVRRRLRGRQSEAEAARAAKSKSSVPVQKVVGTNITIVGIEGKELCGLAKKVPQAKRTGNAAEDNDAMTQRESLVKLIQFIHINPGTASAIWNNVQSGTIFDNGKKKHSKGDDPCWPETYMTTGKLPKYWMASHLCTLTEGQVDKEDCEMLDVVCNTSIPWAWHYITYTQPDDYLPRECLDKARCAKTFFERAKLVDGPMRVTRFLAGLDEQTGQINWHVAGPYRLEWHEVGGREILRAVVHVSGIRVDAPDYMVIDKSWVLIDPAFDMLARLEKPPCAVLRLNTLFEEGRGPHYLPPSRKPPNSLATLAAQLKQQDDTNNAGLRIAHDDFLTEAKNIKTETNAARMRTRMAEHKDTIKRARTFSLPA